MLAENEAYAALLLDSLKKKKKLLTSILESTKQQETILSGSSVNPDEFQKILDEKGKMIQELEQIDNGFDAVFHRLKEEVEKNKEHYRSQILMMQDLIREITDLSIKVQALEKKNNEKFKIYLINEKSKIREVKMSSQTASSYYKNMSGNHQENQSYFFNKTK